MDAWCNIIDPNLFYAVTSKHFQSLKIINPLHIHFYMIYIVFHQITNLYFISEGVLSIIIFLDGDIINGNLQFAIWRWKFGICLIKVGWVSLGSGSFAQQFAHLSADEQGVSQRQNK